MEDSSNESSHIMAGNQSYTAHELALIDMWRSYSNIPDWINKYVPVSAYITGIIANTVLLVYLFTSGKCYRVPVFTLLTNLAICDWLTCLGNRYMAQIAFPELIFEFAANEISKAFSYTLAISYVCSLCHLMFLAGLRYYELVYPLAAKAHATSSSVMKICACLWGFALIITIPYPVYYVVTLIWYENRKLLLFNFVGNSIAKEVCLSVFQQAMPLMLLAVLHSMKLYKVSRGGKLTPQDRRSVSSTTVTVIIVMFVITLLPRFSHTFYHGVLGYPRKHFHLALLIQSAHFSYFNSVADPLVYLLGSKEIRKDIWKTFFGTKSKSK